ncbi:MAG: hypothetical protein LBL67_02235, partial [Coriobacteriales bacterium]|nr:hypothetical protein [Coriobacteriales bacterium]
QNILQEIKGKTGLDDLLDLPATHMYKIKVDFNLTGKPARQEALAEAKPDPDPDSLSPAQSVPPLELNADDIAILRLLQDDISGSLEPFAQIAQELDEASVKLDEAAVIARTQALKASGMVRRFGAMVRHQKIGYAHNIMVAWLVPERGGLAERAGAIMAAQTGVSHCYQRPTAPTWPYNLYSMVHGKSEDDCLATVKDIDWALAAACVPHKPPALLRTVKEWKKTSMRYFL